VIKYTKTKRTIKEICRQYKIINYTINSDGSIDVDGDVDLSDYNLTELPLKFNIVSGYFDCSYNKLTSLDGCPNHVGGHFYCDNNELTYLDGYPSYIVGKFYCYGNPLPQEVIDNPMAEIKRLNREKKIDILLNQ
jgi:hypothetical protein